MHYLASVRMDADNKIPNGNQKGEKFVPFNCQIQSMQNWIHMNLL